MNQARHKHLQMIVFSSFFSLDLLKLLVKEGYEYFAPVETNKIMRTKDAKFRVAAFYWRKQQQIV